MDLFQNHMKCPNQQENYLRQFINLISTTQPKIWHYDTANVILWYQVKTAFSPESINGAHLCFISFKIFQIFKQFLKGELFLGVFVTYSWVKHWIIWSRGLNQAWIDWLFLKFAVISLTFKVAAQTCGSLITTCTFMMM